MGSLRNALIGTTLALGLTAVTASHIAYKTKTQRVAAKNNVKDSVEAAMPTVKRRTDSITGIDGPLNIGYYHDDAKPSGYVKTPSVTDEVDSMHINTETARNVFSMENYDWERRLTRTMWQEDNPYSTILGTVYHEASHVRFAQHFHTVAQDNFDVSLRDGSPLLYVLNEGAATWVQHELGEMQEPAPDRQLYGFNLQERVINGNANVYGGGYNLVEPVLDSLGYKEGITRMIQRPLPSKEEIQDPERYQTRLLDDHE